jgi:heptosyltransferase-2
VVKNTDVKFSKFIDRPIPQVAALISKSDLFISNDTGIMHVAGTTETPQISIFGPTNPFNWAPIGSNKFFIRKSELIDDVAVEDVYHLCEIILNKTEYPR